MSSPDMAAKRCRGSSTFATWRQNDVGGTALSRHGGKTMSGGNRTVVIKGVISNVILLDKGWHDALVEGNGSRYKTEEFPGK